MNSKCRELGIYVHIPFCVSKCIYCDFISFPADDVTKERYIKALCDEIKACAAEEYAKHPDTVVPTIFFGGGTPSSIASHLIAEVLNTVKKEFKVADNCEISMECNPGTLTKSKLEIYKWAGINRLSIGLQSPDNKELKNLGRIHTYEQFEDSYIAARLAGFDNINIDLMSAIPNQTVKGYEKNVKHIIALKPEHISAYSLIVEEGTKLYELVERTKGRILPSEEEDRRMYALTKELLSEAGYNRYEISNYAKSGFECRHNCSYWNRKEYAGFGLSAASLMDEVRYTNTMDMEAYLANPIKNRIEETTLSLNDRMEEFMFLGLRMMKGVSKTEFYNCFGKDFDEIYGQVAAKQLKNGLIYMDNDTIRLTDIGIDISNSVMSDYII